MRKRNIQKIVRFNRKEAQDLAAKAKKACLSEAGLIRLLIRGYEPKEKPDDRFYDVMRELSSIGNNVNQLAAKANTLGFIDAPMLKNEAAKWNKFQSEISEDWTAVCDVCCVQYAMAFVPTAGTSESVRTSRFFESCGV